MTRWQFHPGPPNVRRECWFTAALVHELANSLRVPSFIASIIGLSWPRSGTRWVGKRRLGVIPFAVKSYYIPSLHLPRITWVEFMGPKTSLLQKVDVWYGAPFVKILYLTDLAQKLLSLTIPTVLTRRRLDEILWNFKQKMALTLRQPPQVYCSPSSAQTNVIITPV